MVHRVWSITENHHLVAEAHAASEVWKKWRVGIIRRWKKKMVENERAL